MGLSDRLGAIVFELNISQKKFADSLGVSFTYIKCLINGKRGNLSQPLAFLIEKLYGYSAQWLLYEEGDVSKKIIQRTLKTRPHLITILNTLTTEEIDLVIKHIEYIISETVTNATQELSDGKKYQKKKNIRPV
jgi:plasmid maintenance system antidote protein VapI